MTYATVVELAAEMQIGDALDDDLLQLALEAATEAIDGHCNRHFRAATSGTRVYRPDGSLVRVDDVTTVTQIETRASHRSDWQEVPVADVELRPLNASADGEPHTRLVFPVPRTVHRVRVTGSFGWPATPKAVKRATLLQASRLAKRREAPFGVSHIDLDGGGVRLLAKLDADVELLLKGLRRDTVLVG